MIQLVDVTHNIYYDKQRSDNFFLSMVNACVSHELRNPLNSICAQNIEKKYLYQYLENLIEDQSLSNYQLRNKVRDILIKLKEGMFV